MPRRSEGVVVASACVFLVGLIRFYPMVGDLALDPCNDA
jgi:hypothetical protein